MLQSGVEKNKWFDFTLDSRDQLDNKDHACLYNITKSFAATVLLLLYVISHSSYQLPLQNFNPLIGFLCRIGVTEKCSVRHYNPTRY